MSDVILPETSPTNPASPPAPTGGASLARVGGAARYVFWLMFIINFLNYLDRWVFTGLSPVIQRELRINDFEIGLLNSAFLIIYTLVAAPLGFLADRIARKAIVAAGLAIWSVATALTGLVAGFPSLLGVRAILGIGEGSYYPAGTPLLAAYYPPARRATTLSRWSMAALIGAAAGFLLAAGFSSPGAWRYAFFFTGAPGLIFAVLFWRVREKKRHEQDPAETSGARRGVRQKIGAILRIPTVRVIVAVHAFGFFALTSVTTFLPIYLGDLYGRTVVQRDQYGAIIGQQPGAYPQAGLTPGLIPILAGGLVLLGGVFGTLFGGALADRLAARFAGARVLAGGLGFLLAAPCVLLAVGAPYALRALPAYGGASESTQVVVGVAVFAVFALLAAFFLNVYNGPLSAALLDVVPAGDRAAAGGAELTLAHLLGDVYAAALVGALAELLTQRLGGEQIGLALLLTCPLMLLCAGVIGIWGSRFYTRDIAAL